MRSVKRIFAISMLAASVFALADCGFSPARYPDFSVETKTAPASSYKIFHQKNPHIKFTLTRPLQENENTLLAVAGTYTSVENTVLGFVVLDGSIIQSKEREAWDGAAIFQNGSVEIIQTNNGALLAKEKLQEIAAQGSSLIQGHLLVSNGVAQHFKPQLLYRRRALAVMSDGASAIIESETELDLNVFVADLVSLGAQSALNLDMGGFSEGWYRDPQTGVPIIIGEPSDSTSRQSNWIILNDASR